MTLVGILVPAALVTLAVRRWYAPLPWRIALLSLLLAVGFLAGSLFTSRIPLPVDEVLRGYPWRGIYGVAESRNPLTNDTVKQILPWMQVAREEIFAGRLPLWNRYQYSGYPLLANGQSAPLSPLFLATLFVPLPGQLVAMAGLKLFLALLFGWLFLRDEGVSASASLLGSALFAFSVFQSVYLYYPMTSVSALLPAAAFAVRRTLRGHARRDALLLAVITATVAAAGHPESAVHLAIGAFVVIALEYCAGAERPPLRAVIRPIAAALLGAAIAAPAWVPVAEQALASVRAQALALAPHVSMNGTAAWALLNADGFGNPSRGGWRWIYNYAMVAPTYVGLLPMALAVAACFARRRRELLLVCSAVILFFVAMDWTIAGHALNALPLLSMIAPDRLRFVVVFLAGIVAARMVDRWSSGELAQIRGARLSYYVAAAIIGAAAVWLLRAKWGVTLGWSSVAGVGALAFFTIVAAIRPRWAAIAAAAAIVVELFVTNAGFNVPRPREWYRPPVPILEEARRRTADEPVRIVGHDWTLLPNAASQYGLEDVRGHDPMALGAYQTFLRTLAADDPSSDVLRIQNLDDPALAFLNVRFAITDPGVTPSALWALRYEGPDGKLFERTSTARRFFVSGGAATIGTIEQKRPTLLEVEIDAQEPARIGSSQVYARGWRVVTSEGARLPVRIERGTFIGFDVPRGRHRVRVEYVPWTFYGSLPISALAAIGALFASRRRAAVH